MSDRIRVLLAEDHTVVREGLATLIGLHPRMAVAGQADNGRDAVRLYAVPRPDVLLLDLALPEMTGNEVIRAVRREFGQARILVLTTFDYEEAIFDALHGGAAGYLLKTASSETLYQALETVHAGRHWRLTESLAERLVERVAEEGVSGRELRVLAMLAKGMSNEDIASALGISGNTVKTHLQNIYRKLGVGNRTEAVAEAARRGLVQVGG